MRIYLESLSMIARRSRRFGTRSSQTAVRLCSYHQRVGTPVMLWGDPATGCTSLKNANALISLKGTAETSSQRSSVNSRLLTGMTPPGTILDAYSNASPKPPQSVAMLPSYGTFLFTPS